MNIKTILILIFLTVLSSCTTIYMNESKSAAEEVVDSLNRGDSSLPIHMSRVPFVFDGEIIIAETSVSKVWNGLVKAGFIVTNPVITSISPVVSTDYALFRSSWEMEMFFKRNIPEFSYKVTIEGIDGEVLMLISREKTRNYALIGLRADAK